MKLSDKINAIAGSQTVAFTTLIQQLRVEGRQIIDLAVGEPQFDTSTLIIDATQNALAAKKTRYSPVNGLAELRTQLAAQFDGYAIDNILMTNGSKQGLYMIFQAICDPADEVIVPVPYLVSFIEQIKMAGGRPVPVTAQNHQLDVDAIAQAVRPRTKAILINSPNNPSGAVYPMNDLQKIVRLAEDHDLFIVADEAYKDFVYDDSVYKSIFDIASARERLIVLHTKIDKSPDELCKGLSDAGLPNLFIPSPDSFLEIDELPMLGTGKLDLKRVRQIARDKFEGQ